VTPLQFGPTTPKLLVAAFVGATVVAGAVRAQPAGGLIGEPLAVAERNELFTFFNLAETGRQTCGGGELLGFRPTGAQFHALASVSVVTDAKGDIGAMILMLDRSFIDDPANGVFARDIAKSFLRDVSGPSPGAIVARLAAEIEAGAASSGTVIYQSGAAPAPPPGPPSAAYRVFLGGDPSFLAISGGEALGVANGSRQGHPELRLSLARPPGPDCAIGDVPG
jgi:hypothetical protein